MTPTPTWRGSAATRTAARPGPGPIADPLVQPLELTVDRILGQMSGDHPVSVVGPAWRSTASGLCAG